MVGFIRSSPLYAISILGILLCTACADAKLTITSSQAVQAISIRTDGYYLRDTVFSNGIANWTLYYLCTNGNCNIHYGRGSVEFLNNVDSMSISSRPHLDDKLDWGRYYITKDSIIVINHWTTSVGGGLNATTKMGKVLSSTHFVLNKGLTSDGETYPFKERHYYFKELLGEDWSCQPNFSFDE